MGYFGGWPPYVSAAERREKAEEAAAKAKKSGATLTSIAPFRGAIAKTFWGKAWCDNLERYSDYASRLPRGRTYVRNGSVIDLQITPGEVRAQVMGSSLYTVTASVTQVPEKQWKTICADCSGSIASLVELLQGKLSNAVMERICKPGSGLFPSPKEISFECSCPDWAGMCKHVAAVLYGIGARLDQQPDIIFSLRRVDAKDLVQQAQAGLQPSSKRVAPAKVLDDALLADVFGLEMADVPKPVTKANAAPQKAPLAAKTAVAKKAATRKVAATETRVKKPSPAMSKTASVAVKRPRGRPAKEKKPV
ncbi:SWIM zinc finger family protein [Polaromonas glacialis]|uniref:SWIM zinc finger family protein n=1 Tax=Polaromonas glacialis TaxID=866564 RepID=UPI00055D5BD7|nr:SWIM zinc finger family protein [Polaromonas glacialis]